MSYLLPLADHELHAVLDALNAVEDDGIGTQDIAQDVADRVRVLLPLASVQAEQLLKCIGIGRYEGRGQG